MSLCGKESQERIVNHNKNENKIYLILLVPGIYGYFTIG